MTTAVFLDDRFDRRERAEFDALLRARKRRARMRLARIEFELHNAVFERDVSDQLDREHARPSVDGTDFEVVTALRDRLRAEVVDVDAALGRLAAGEFGRCVQCGDDIPLARLRARPAAIRCVSCQFASEPRRR